MISKSIWAPLFRRAGASGASLRNRPNCLLNNQVVESCTNTTPLRRYTAQREQAKPKLRRTGLYVLGAVVLAGTVAVSVSDEARYIYIAAQRTGRVVSALALNINEYVEGPLFSLRRCLTVLLIHVNSDIDRL